MLYIPFSEIKDHEALSLVLTAREMPEREASRFLARNSRAFYRYVYTALQDFYRTRVISINRPKDFDLIFVTKDLDHEEVLPILAKYEIRFDIPSHAKVRVAMSEGK